MQIDEARKLLYSDTLVPDVFISDFLPELSGDAVKIYLFILQVGRDQRQVSSGEIGRRLGMDLDTMKATLFELVNKGIITYDKDKNRITLLDIKDIAVEKYYKPRTSAAPSELREHMREHPERNEVIDSINSSYFAGKMGYSWYNAIDDLFEIYGFEAEVVYCLFKECADRGKLKKAYLKTVAEDWASQDIRTYSDYNLYRTEHDQTQQIANHVGKTLRKHMTEPDLKLVRTWVSDYGFDREIIDIALERATAVRTPNLNYFHAILTEWHQQKLDTPAAIRSYEARSAETRKSTAPSSTRVSSVGNFAQRDYGDGFFDQFEEQLPLTESDSTQNCEPLDDASSTGVQHG